MLDLTSGLAGALLGLLLLHDGRLANVPLTLPAALAATAGAIVLIGLVNLVRRGRVR